MLVLAARAVFRLDADAGGKFFQTRFVPIDPKPFADSFGIVGDELFFCLSHKF